jgi:hypothetical protein
MVEAMLDLVDAESARIDSRFLEPACGSGNFLVQVLRRKLSAVQRKYHQPAGAGERGTPGHPSANLLPLRTSVGLGDAGYGVLMNDGHPGGNELAEPRPLRAEERAALLALLNYANFEGRDALLAQADAARVVGHCDCGCATVDLAVDASAPAAAPSPSPLPNEAAVLGDDGEPVGGVLVFVSDGYLSMLEVYAYDVEPISPFPPMERLRLERGGAAG